MKPEERAPFEPCASLEPGVFDFVVRVHKSAIKGDKKLVPGVTRYKEFPFQQRARSNETWCQNHVFVLDTDGGDGIHEFYFSLDRTGKLMRRPIKSRSFFTTKPHRWDDVLLRMGFIEDPTMPLTMEVAGEIKQLARLFGRYWKLPGGVYASHMTVETFLSPRPFPRSMFLLDIPVPSPVTWDMRNLSGAFNGLHPEVRFRETQQGGRVLEEAGTVGKPIAIQSVQVFPATNHPNWKIHVCDEDVSQDRGVYQLVRTTVEPPGVKKIRNSS